MPVWYEHSGNLVVMSACISRVADSARIATLRASIQQLAPHAGISSEAACQSPIEWVQ